MTNSQILEKGNVMSTVREEVRAKLNEALTKVDNIKDEQKKQLAILGILQTLEDISTTIKQENNIKG